MVKRIFGLVAGDVVDGLGLGLEVDLTARLQPQLDQVLEHLVLGVDGDHPAVGELLQVDAVVAALEADLEAMMDEALALEAIAGADLGHQVDGALLEHAGADGGLDRLARAALDDDRFDAAQVQQLREQQTRWPAPTIPTWVRMVGPSPLIRTGTAVTERCSRTAVAARHVVDQTNDGVRGREMKN